MVFKKTNFFKLFLFLLISFTLVSPTKNLLAVEVDADGTPIEEAEETSTKRANGSLSLSDEVKQEIIDKYKASDEISQEGWGKSMWFATEMVGLDISIGDVEAMLNNPSWTPGGLIGFTNSAIASLYHPPISGTQYIANSINNILSKPTYAASTGGAFNNLQEILPIWKTCRNAIYVLFSIVFIIMGLLIMLRVKISPQATITIQNSIPKIIITLILVTFSYAIIGLLIDLTYLVQALVLSLLINNNTKGLLANTNIADLIKGSFDTFKSLATNAMYSSDLTAVNATLSALGAIVGAAIGGISGGWQGAAAGTAIGVTTGALILSIFALIQMIRFFFGCAKTYIVLLIKIVSAPIEIAIGAFPNSKIGFGSWFIQTLGYASVFPISMIFLVFLNIICNAVSFSNMWTPGVLESSIVSPYIGSIIGIAGLIILPKLPDLIPEAIFQIKPSPFGKALTEGAKAYPGHRIVGAVTGVAKSGINFYAGQQASAFMATSRFGDWMKEREVATNTRRAERAAARTSQKSKESGSTNRHDENNKDF